MQIKIGINPNTWTLDDVPELKHFTPLATCLTEARQSGYSGIEMGGIFPRSSAELKPLLAQHGLSLIAGWYDGRIRDRDPQAEFDALLPYLGMLRDMGAACIVYADTTDESFSDTTAPLSRRPRLPEHAWPGYGAKVTALADKMAAFGVPMAFHHHIGTIVESDDDVDRLMRHTGESAGLLFDGGHCLLAGGDPVALARRHARRINHFHGKDVRGGRLAAVKAADASFVDAVMDGVFTVPGDGIIDYGAILTSLREAGYHGWLVVEAEQDLRKADPLTYARLGFAHMTRLAKAAGFDVAP